MLVNIGTLWNVKHTMFIIGISPIEVEVKKARKIIDLNRELWPGMPCFTAQKMPVLDAQLTTMLW